MYGCALPSVLTTHMSPSSRFYDHPVYTNKNPDAEFEYKMNLKYKFDIQHHPTGLHFTGVYMTYSDLMSKARNELSSWCEEFQGMGSFTLCKVTKGESVKKIDFHPSDISNVICDILT